MKVFQSAGTARILLAVTVAVCLFLGARIGLGGSYREAMEVWYNGEAGDGASCAKWMGERVSAAYNVELLVRGAGKIVPGLDALSAAVSAMQNTEDPAALLRLDGDLEVALQQVSLALPSALSGNDLKNANAQLEKARARADVIAHDGYLRLARQHNEALDKFPASILGPITGIKDAPVY